MVGLYQNDELSTVRPTSAGGLTVYQCLGSYQWFSDDFGRMLIPTDRIRCDTTHDGFAHDRRLA